MCCLAARLAEMIRIDAVWLATEPVDMRAGTDTALARVVKVFGAAHPNQAYLLVNRRANRIEKCWCMTASVSGWRPGGCTRATSSGHLSTPGCRPA